MFTESTAGQGGWVQQDSAGAGKVHARVTTRNRQIRRAASSSRRSSRRSTAAAFRRRASSATASRWGRRSCATATRCSARPFASRRRARRGGGSPARARRQRPLRRRLRGRRSGPLVLPDRSVGRPGRVVPATRSSASTTRARPTSPRELAEGALLLGRDSLTLAEALAAKPGDRSEKTLVADARGRRRPRARARSAPGTSSSRARGAASPASSACSPSSRSSGSTSCTCRRSTRSGVTNRKGQEQHADAGARRRRAARGRSAGRTAVTRGQRRPRDARGVRAARRARAASSVCEIALDFAIQCSPDHPWLREHPEWFHRRPDGTLKYAENPPKKYQDIYNVNFACRGLARALAGAARRGALLGRARRQGVPRRQPAHEAGPVLGVADLGGAHCRAGRRLPVGGVHARRR